jgi:hypothetical protein
MLLISVFIGFHLLVLVVSAVPSSGASARLHDLLDRYAGMRAYISLAGTAGKWGMFAPDAPRVNVYMRVLVEDREGKAHDLAHDIYGKRQYPYLFFDRMGSINWLVSALEAYRPAYAAWVCRDWERTHAGQPARAASLVTFVTVNPPPQEAVRSNGYHPMLLDLRRVATHRFECASVPHGQLPDDLRARSGLPPRAPGTFREITTRTWWTDKHGHSSLPTRDRPRPGSSDKRN